MIESNDDEELWAERRSGFTTFELLISVAVTSVLFVTFLGVTDFMLRDSEQTLARATSRAEAVAFMSELQQAIRLADEIEAAGEGVLTLKTRFMWDLNSDWEKVRYTRVGSSIYRELKDGGGPYGTPELIMEGVERFETHAFELTEGFPGSVYSDVTGLIFNDSVDRIGVKATYESLAEMEELDSDVQSSLNLLSENLTILNILPLERKRVTLTPWLRKEGLVGSVMFTPNNDGGRYRALYYGLEDATSSVSVVFESDQTVLLEVKNGAATTSVDMGRVWAAGDVYEVSLMFRQGNAYGTVVFDEVESSAVIDSTAVDKGGFHVMPDSDFASGEWDDVAVHYPFVEVELELANRNGANEVLYGGSGRRQQ